jgi:SH3 domain protein
LTILIMGTFFLCPIPLWAKSMYITDQIEIGLRSGIGLEYRVLSMVKTGDRVEVLEGDKNWSKVKLQDGTVGWINSRFLSDQIKPVIPLDPKFREELRGVKEANQTLAQEKEILTKEKNRLNKELEEAKKLTHSLQQEKTKRISPELTDLKAKNQQLDQEVSVYKKQAAEFSQKDKKQRTEEMIKWFLAGSAVLFLGLVLGWFLSRGRHKSQRYY